MGSETDPDQRDKQTDRSDIDILQRCIRRCLPGLIPEPAVVESCMYTVSINSSHYCVHCFDIYTSHNVICLRM